MWAIKIDADAIGISLRDSAEVRRLYLATHNLNKLSKQMSWRLSVLRWPIHSSIACISNLYCCHQCRETPFEKDNMITKFMIIDNAKSTQSQRKTVKSLTKGPQAEDIYANNVFLHNTSTCSNDEKRYRTQMKARNQNRRKSNKYK